MRFNSEEFLAPHPIPKLEEHPLSAVRDSLFNIFAATLDIGGRSSSRNLTTRHSVVTGPTIAIVVVSGPPTDCFQSIAITRV
jgi:hypothetical protein